MTEVGRATVPAFIGRRGGRPYFPNADNAALISGFFIEPQNTEQGIMNVEGKENFIIRHSLFDIQSELIYND
jgi:hypothetical protein